MRIALIGSIKHVDLMEKMGNDLRGMGHDVVVPKLSEAERTGTMTPDIKGRLIRGYFPELEKADAVLVANEERKGIPGYIGANTFLEMSVAYYLNKPLYLLHPLSEKLDCRDEVVAMQPVVLNGALGEIGKQ